MLTTAKLPAELVKKARIVAATRSPRMTLMDYLTSVLKKPVEQDLAKAARGLMSKAPKGATA
jgi:hypothetical protein